MAASLIDQTRLKYLTTSVQEEHSYNSPDDVKLKKRFLAMVDAEGPDSRYSSAIPSDTSLTNTRDLWSTIARSHSPRDEELVSILTPSTATPMSNSNTRSQSPLLAVSQAAGNISAQASSIEDSSARQSRITFSSVPNSSNNMRASPTTAIVAPSFALNGFANSYSPEFTTAENLTRERRRSLLKMKGANASGPLILTTPTRAADPSFNPGTPSDDEVEPISPLPASGLFGSKRSTVVPTTNSSSSDLGTGNKEKRGVNDSQHSIANSPNFSESRRRIRPSKSRFSVIKSYLSNKSTVSVKKGWVGDDPEDTGILLKSRYISDAFLDIGYQPRELEKLVDEEGKPLRIRFDVAASKAKTVAADPSSPGSSRMKFSAYLHYVSPRQWLHDRPILSDTSLFLVCWTILRSSVMVFVFFRMFLYVAFHNDINYTWLEAADIIISIDMIVTLHAPYHIGTTVITDPKLIASNYFGISRGYAKFWDSTCARKTFLVDFLALVPFHLFKQAFLTTPPANGLFGISFDVIRYLSLLQYPFVCEVLETSRRLEIDIHQDVQRIAIFKFVLFMFMGTHGFGCLWWYLASQRDFDCKTWVGQYLRVYLRVDEDYIASQLDADALANFNDRDCQPEMDVLKMYNIETFMHKYELTLFWGCNSLTNLGYSDITPNNQAEMIYAIFLLLFQVIFYSYILALGFNFIFKKDEKIENYKKTLLTLKMYGQTRNLPADLRARLNLYFDFQQQKKDSENDEVLISQMPANILTEYSSFVKSCVILKTTSPQFTNALMTMLRQKYLMPNEILFKIEDMSREMCFITQGEVIVFADIEMKQFVKNISSSNHFGSQVGEIAFFMSMPQRFQVIASRQSDVSLLSLSKVDYELCINQYPESHGTIISTILSIFGMNNVGRDVDKSNNEMSGMTSVIAEDGELFKEIKEDIRMALVKRNEDALGTMIALASQGDVDEVKKMLAQGLDVNAGDYDSRTTLHLAAAEGNIRVVQALLQQGADVQVTDRWGNEPLHDAIVNKHELVAELLTEHGAELNYDNPSGMLCTAAADGDVDQLNQLVSHGISPNSADYDGRTALHLGSSEGNMKVVEMLISNPHNKADVNVRDRWNNTPLDDAVLQGHELVCMLLHEAGGRMNLEYASGALCQASSTGNIIRLKLLQRHGADIMEGDYDDRNALHLAAAEGQMVSTDFLLNCKAEVNFKDRWGRVALDDALEEKHWKVAKLIVAAGGRSSSALTIEQITSLDEIDLGKVRREVALTVKQQDQRHSRKKEIIELAKQMVVDSASARVKVSRALQCVEEALEKMQNNSLSSTYQDSRLLSLTSYNRAAVEKHFSLLDIHTPSTRIMDLRETQNFAMERFMSRRYSGTPLSTTAPVISFNSFHQVILQFPQIQSSLDKLRKDMAEHGIPAIESTSNEVEIQASNLLKLLRDYGIPCNSQTVEGIFFEAAVAVGMVAPMMSKRGLLLEHNSEEDKTVTFANLLESITFCNLFVRHNVPHNAHASGIAQGFRVINGAFELLDSDSNGKLIVNKLLLMKNVFGNEKETNHDDIRETFFGSKKIILRKEFPIVMAKLVGIIDTEQITGGMSEDGDSSLDRMSDNWSASEGLRSSLAIAVITKVKGETPAKTGDAYDQLLEFEVKRKKEGHHRICAKEVEMIRTKVKMTWKDIRAKLFWVFEHYLPTNNFTVRKIDQSILDKFQIEGTSSGQYEEAFRSFDMNRNGIIDIGEFEQLMLSVFNINIPSRYKQIMFERFDRRKAGEISFDDFAFTLRAMFESRKSSQRNMERRLENIVIPEGTPWFILHPRSTFLEVYWKWVVLSTILCYIFLVPYTIAFFHRTTTDVYMNWYMIGKVSWNRIFLFLDFVLWLDITFKFLTAYLNKRSVYVFKRQKITRHYLKNGFFFDALAAFPFDLFFEFNNASKNSIAWIRVLRLFNIRRVTNEIKVRTMKKSDSMSDLTGHAFTLGVMLHILACLFYYITNEEVDGNENFLNNKFLDPPYAGYGSVHRLDRTDVDMDFKFDEWVFSLYWCFGTMSAMGHGNLKPSNTKERIVMIVVMLLNLSLYAYFLGALSAMFMSRDEALVHTKSEVASVQRFIERRTMSKKLENDIRGTFEFRANQKANGMTQEQESEVYRSLSHTLQVEVARHISRGLLDRVISLRNCNFNFLDSMSTVLREVTIAPSNFVFEINDTCKNLHILSHGQLMLLDLDTDTNEMVESPGILEPGAVPGEVEFFFGIRHRMSCKTLSNGIARLFTLSQENYQNLIKLYPSDEDVINKNILCQPGGSGDDTLTAKGSSIGNGTKSDMSAGVSSKAPNGDASSQISGGSADSKYSTMSFDMTESGASQQLNSISTARKKKEMERVCAMCSACAKGEIESLKHLLGADRLTVEGDYDLRTPLHLAASEGMLSCVEFLIERMDLEFLSPLDRFGGTPLSDAVRHKHDKVASFLRDKNAKMPSSTDRAGELCTAAADSDMNQLKRLVSNQYDLNSGDYDKRTAIHLAASNGNLEVCVYLQSMWADLNPCDRWGGTPLADAIRHGHKEVASFLKKNNAHLPLDMDVAGMLCEAASKGDIEVLQTYYSNGIDLNLGDYDARTALHLACSCNQLAVVDFLLKNCEGSVDVNPVDRLGNTPLDDCIREGFDWLAIILQKHDGVQKGHVSLLAKVETIKIASKLRVEMKARELQKAERLDSSNIEIAMILREAIDEMNVAVPKLKVGLDTLVQAMQSRSKKKLSKKIISRSRNPDLDELIDFFTDSIFAYARDHQKVNELNAYNAIRNIVNEGKPTGKMCSIVRGFADTYLSYESGVKISASPEEKEELLGALKELEIEAVRVAHGVAYAPGHTVLSGLITTTLMKIKQSIETQLAEVIAKYYGSNEYLLASRSRLSKAWRCLVISKGVYENSLWLLEKIDRLKVLSTTNVISVVKKEAEEKKVIGGGVDDVEMMNLLEEKKAAYKETLKSEELRKTISVQSEELSVMFESVETIAIRACSVLKEDFSAYQHKAKILESQKTKENDMMGDLAQLGQRKEIF